MELLSRQIQTRSCLRNTWYVLCSITIKNKDTTSTSTGVFIVNFEHIPHLLLVLLLLTLNIYLDFHKGILYFFNDGWMETSTFAN